MAQIVDQRSGADRRTKHFAFRFPDRRLGFGRRAVHRGRVRMSYDRAFATYRAAPHALAVVLVAILMLNVADLMLTLRAIELGATEMNPIMATLINANPLLAALFKAAAVIGVVSVIWVMRRYRLVLEASLVILGGFVALSIYSASMLILAS